MNLMIFPKCPLYKSVLQLGFTLAMIAFGVMGIYFLNLWIAVSYSIYSVMFYFLAMPLWHCKYCYYKVKESPLDKKERNSIVKLIPVDKWKELYLEKHVACGKKWGINISIIWLAPIVLTVISFFLRFSIFALISLISFIVILVVQFLYMKKKICTKCAIVDECHSSF